MVVKKPRLLSYERIRREHELLGELIDKIRRSIAARDAGPEGVSFLLAKLSRSLRAHFKVEESGGFYDQILLDVPRYSGRIDALCVEHSQILDEAREMAEKYKECQNTDAWWDVIARDYQHFSQRLVEHEHEENDLVQEAYNEDIGTKD